MKPLLLLDVDGPLNPYAAKPERRPAGYSTHRMRPVGFERKPLRVWLNHDHGAALLGLGYDLVWCTTWEAQANTWISPPLGLPELPVIHFGPSPRRVDARVHWKMGAVLEYAAGRSFAWVDDEIDRWDVDYVARNHDRPALLHRIDPAKGLREDDFALLAAWVA